MEKVAAKIPRRLATSMQGDPIAILSCQHPICLKDRVCSCLKGHGFNHFCMTPFAFIFHLIFTFRSLHCFQMVARKSSCMRRGNNGGSGHANILLPQGPGMSLSEGPRSDPSSQGIFSVRFSPSSFTRFIDSKGSFKSLCSRCEGNDEAPVETFSFWEVNEEGKCSHLCPFTLSPAIQYSEARRPI